MIKILMAAILCLSTGACVSTDAGSAPGTSAAATLNLEVNRPHILSSAQIAAIKGGIKDTLKEPDGVRFGPMVGAVTEKGVYLACGLVSAKIKGIGYSTMRPYMGVFMGSEGYRGWIFNVSVIGSDAISQQAVRMVCQKDGLLV